MNIAVTTFERPAAAPRDRSRLLDAWIFLTLLIPIYGTCFPPQSYFYSGDIHEQTYEVGPLMPTILLILAGSIAIMAMHMLRQRRRIVHDPLIYLFALAAFVSLRMSPEPLYGFNRALRLLPLIGFGVLYAQIVPQRKIVSLMTLAFLVSACVSIAICIFLPEYGYSHYQGAYEFAWRGALLHKNAAGLIYAIGIIVSVHGLTTYVEGRRIAILSILACTFMVLKSESVTALVNAIVSLSAYAAFRAIQALLPRSRLLFVTATLVGAGATAIVGPMLFAAVLELIGRDATLTGRTDVWPAVWYTIQQAPISGHGYGFWGTESPALERIIAMVGQYQNPGHSHEDWLDIWLQIGIVGVIAIAANVLYILLRTVSILITDDATTLALPFALTLFMLIRSFVEVQFTDPGPADVFWLVWCAVNVRALCRVRAERRRRIALMPPLRPRSLITAS